MLEFEHQIVRGFAHETSETLGRTYGSGDFKSACMIALIASASRHVD